MIDLYFDGEYYIGICRATGNYLLKTFQNEWHKFRFIYKSPVKEEAWVCPETDTYFFKGGVHACSGCGKYHLAIKKDNSFFLFTDRGELFDLEEELYLQDEIQINIEFASHIAESRNSAWLEHQFIFQLPAGPGLPGVSSYQEEH